MGARNESSVAAAIKMRWRRKLCIANVREHHRLKLRRLDALVKGSLNGYSGSAAGHCGTDGQHHERRQAYDQSMGYTSRPTPGGGHRT